MVLLCEICGSRPARGKHAVEGAILSVCEKCGKFGNEVRDVFVKKGGFRGGGRASPEDTEPQVALDYAKKIRAGREKQKLTHKELADKSNERESVIAKIEQGDFVPTIPTAKKLEKILGISLIETGEREAGKQVQGPKASAGMTFGDMIKMKAPPGKGKK